MTMSTDKQRTDLVEEFIESFAGVPLTAECVHRSPQYLDKSGQEEVCDLLIVLRGQAILISMKSQADPTSRTGNKLTRWTIKNAKKALGQGKGAIRNMNTNRFWCLHPRRGRVDFEPSTLKINHLIVTTEILGERVEVPDSFDLSVDGIPVSYLAVNDLCNLIHELRTFPDLDHYLSARQILPAKTRRSVGDERPLFEYYILNNGSFNGCQGYEDARIVTAVKQADVDVYAYFKSVRRRLSGIIECVSDRLATRMDRCTEDLEPTMAAFYDEPAKRRNYLLMQEELCDLRLREREALGLQFTQAIEKVEKSNEIKNMSYASAWVDSKPDFVYVLISSKGVDRSQVIFRSNLLLRAAMANYRKPRGMVIADRDQKNFEVQLMVGFSPSPTDVKLGEEYFSRLKMSDVEMGHKSSSDFDTSLVV